jgi:hypothetical protein
MVLKYSGTCVGDVDTCDLATKTDLASLAARVTTLEGLVSANQGDITTNAGGISTNAGGLSTATTHRNQIVADRDQADGTLQANIDNISLTPGEKGETIAYNTSSFSTRAPTPSVPRATPAPRATR